MISYITCSNNTKILDANLKASLDLYEKDELIVISSPESLSKGYNEGIQKAQNEIKCFVHNDVVIKDSAALRALLITYTKQINFGVIGAIGAKDIPKGPW